jgi:hypothetical protein
MTNETMMLQRIDALTSAVQFMAAAIGQRLTRAQLCERLGVSDNTLRKREALPGFPRRDGFGRFLLSDIIAWETQQTPKNPQ